ncbi:MAG: rane protein [Chitinophagaceae bacterium]|nr:rane protein [Chitinophagaceae bacterium]
MQFFWLYLDDLVGKNLDFLTLAKLIGFVSATAVPLALPLALLLSSIMTFGNLGESFELVAIKSAGISLNRFMRPLLVIAIFIAGIAFLFANNIIPVANLKMAALKYDIIVTKPAFDIKEGVFYDKIEGFAIKIGKKEKDDSTIRNVIIYERNFNLQDFVMTAESGIMRATADKKYLEFVLHNGWRYEEKGPRGITKTDFTRSSFQQYKKVFDLSSFKMNKTDDTLFRYDPKMLSVRQLVFAVDSMNRLNKAYLRRSRSELYPYLTFFRYRDSSFNPPANVPVLKSLKQLSSDTSIMKDIAEKALGQISIAKSSLEMLANDDQARRDMITKHWIEWNRKFALSVACIVLFMIGAPLGSIIRKGGLGTPMVFAVIFFVLFHLLNTFGEKFAKEHVTSPFIGMWLSTLILIPVGFFLTLKAMRDSQLFNQEFYFRFLRNVKTFIQRKTKSSS